MNIQRGFCVVFLEMMQIVKFENRNIVAKLWAIMFFMAGNTLIEHLIFDMLSTSLGTSRLDISVC